MKALINKGCSLTLKGLCMSVLVAGALSMSAPQPAHAATCEEFYGALGEGLGIPIGDLCGPGGVVGLHASTDTQCAPSVSAARELCSAAIVPGSVPVGIDLQFVPKNTGTTCGEGGTEYTCNVVTHPSR